MPRSINSEDSDQQSLLTQDDVELEMGEKMLPDMASSTSRFRPFIPACTSNKLVISVALAITIGILMFITFLSRSRHSSNVLTKHCGSTAEEAIVLGCKFDMINYAWQPPECFDEELYNRWWKKAQEHGPLKLYSDSNFTTELPLDIEVLMHTPYVWSGHRYHILHCMYAIELMHHAVTLDKPLVERYSLFNHTMHCADTVLENDWKVQNTSIKAAFNRCVRLA